MKHRHQGKYKSRSCKGTIFKKKPVHKHRKNQGNEPFRLIPFTGTKEDYKQIKIEHIAERRDLKPSDIPKEYKTNGRVDFRKIPDDSIIRKKYLPGGQDIPSDADYYVLVKSTKRKNQQTPNFYDIESGKATEIPNEYLPSNMRNK